MSWSASTSHSATRSDASSRTSSTWGASAPRGHAAAHRGRLPRRRHPLRGGQGVQGPSALALSRGPRQSPTTSSASCTSATCSTPISRPARCGSASWSATYSSFPATSSCSRRCPRCVRRAAPGHRRRRVRRHGRHRHPRGPRRGARRRHPDEYDAEAARRRTSSAGRSRSRACSTSRTSTTRPASSSRRAVRDRGRVRRGHARSPSGRGREVTVEGHRLTVTELDGRRVARVQVTEVPLDPAPGEGQNGPEHETQWRDA